DGGGCVGFDFGAGFLGFGVLALFEAFAVGGFVVGVAGEVGDPGVGAGAPVGRVVFGRGGFAVFVYRGGGGGGDSVVGGGARVGRVEFVRSVFAVFFDRGGGRFQGFDEGFFRAFVALVEVEGDGAFAGRADQAGEGGDVFDLFADGDRGGGVGFDFGAGFLDFGVLAFFEAFAFGGFVVGVAGEAGDPV